MRRPRKLGLPLLRRLRKRRTPPRFTRTSQLEALEPRIVLAGPNPDYYHVEPLVSFQTDENALFYAHGVLFNDRATCQGTPPTTTTLIQDVQNGTLNFQTDGSFSYTSDVGFKGIDSFRYGDPNDPQQQTMAYLLVHHQPSAHDDFYQTTPDTPITVGSVPSLLDNDVDFQQVLEIVNLVPITGPDNGTLTLNEDGTFLYVKTSWTTRPRSPIAAGGSTCAMTRGPARSASTSRKAHRPRIRSTTGPHPIPAGPSRRRGGMPSSRAAWAEPAEDRWARRAAAERGAVADRSACCHWRRWGRAGRPAAGSPTT